jgi:hypothetical protein
VLINANDLQFGHFLSRLEISRRAKNKYSHKAIIIWRAMDLLHLQPIAPVYTPLQLGALGVQRNELPFSVSETPETPRPFRLGRIVLRLGAISLGRRDNEDNFHDWCHRRRPNISFSIMLVSCCTENLNFALHPHWPNSSHAIAILASSFFAMICDALKPLVYLTDDDFHQSKGCRIYNTLNSLIYSAWRLYWLVGLF